MLPDFTPAPACTTYALVSGKGGVGKSLTAVNLAETFAAQGLRTALMDVDFGQAATPVLLNEAPRATLRAVAQGRARLADALHHTPTGLTLVVGSDEAAEAALYPTLDHTLAHLRATHDAVVIDAPAGLDGPVRWALDRADLGLLVVVAEPTAVADAYQLVKTVWQADAAYPFALVVNAADFEADAEATAARFSLLTERFLGQPLPLAGWLPYSAPLRQSVRAQTPAVRQPGSADRWAFETLAAALRTGLVRWPIPEGGHADLF